MKKRNDCLDAARRRVLSILPTARHALLLPLLVFAHSVLAADPLDQPVQVNIPTGTALDLAVIQLGEQITIQTGVNVMLASNSVGQQTTEGLRGTLPAKTALTTLLRGSGLSYEASDNTVTVLPIVERRAGDPQSFRTAQATTSKEESATQGAQANSTNARASDKGKRERVSLEEIIVTAQKRSEKLMEVPSSIGVISGARLESLQSYSLPDFAGYVPGLTVAAGGSPGQNTLVIRGLSTGYSNATTGSLVATYIDDVPTGSSTSAARGALYGLDLMPYDIERIEVLRGPQGTLYGADAMGGLVKYSLRKPDLTEVEARIGGDVQDVNGSGGVDWGGRASVNLPVIADTLGIRASGFYQSNAGYIDNVGTGTRHANHSTERGGRATVLWKPADGLSVQATVLAQSVRSADQTAITLDGTTMQPVYGPQARSTLFLEPFTQELRSYWLSVDWDLHFATLTNSSSWSSLNSEFQQDLTPVFGSLVPYPGGLARYSLGDKVSKFTEELRLTSPEHQQIQWMLGAFYTKENGQEDENIPAFTPSYVPLPAADLILTDSIVSTYKEKAVFGNATFKISDYFDLGSGARYAQNTQTYCTPLSIGLFGSGLQPCASRPYVGVATWMADARFHLDRDSMFYLRWATGYRPSGCNNGCVVNSQLEIPATFGPDKVTNYEAGFKGQFLDHRLQLDLSAFHIAWRDIQATVVNALGLVYTGNGGTATSNGFELTTSYQTTDRLSLQATLGHTDAHLTRDAPGVGGKSGDQLPESPRWSASLTAEYHQPLSARRQFVLGGGYRYRDTVNNQLTGSGQPLPIGPQNIVDLYTGLVMNGVSGRIYAKNVFSNRTYMGLLYLTDPPKPMFVPVQPRTVGISVDYQIR